MFYLGFLNSLILLSFAFLNIESIFTVAVLTSSFTISNISVILGFLSIFVCLFVCLSVFGGRKYALVIHFYPVEGRPWDFKINFDRYDKWGLPFRT